MDGDDKKNRKRHRVVKDDNYRQKASRPDREDRQLERVSRSDVDRRSVGVGDDGNGADSRISDQNSFQDYSRRDTDNGWKGRHKSGSENRDTRAAPRRENEVGSQDGSRRENRDRGQVDPRIQTGVGRQDGCRRENRDRSRVDKGIQNRADSHGDSKRENRDVNKIDPRIKHRDRSQVASPRENRDRNRVDPRIQNGGESQNGEIGRENRERSCIDPGIQNRAKDIHGSRRENRDRSRVDPGIQNRHSSQDGSRKKNWDRSRGDPGMQNRDSSQDGSRKKNRDRCRGDPEMQNRDSSQDSSRRENRDRNRVDPGIQNGGESQNGYKRENRDRSRVDPGKQNRDNSQDGSRRENLDRNRGDPGIQNRDSSQDSSRRENQDRNRVNPGIQNADESQNGSRRENRDRSGIDPGIQTRDDNLHGSRRKNGDGSRVEPGIQNRDRSQNSCRKENRDKSPFDPGLQNRDMSQDGSRREIWDSSRVDPGLKNRGRSQDGSRRENRDRSAFDPGLQNRDRSQDGTRRENRDRNRGDPGIQNRDSSQDSSRRENQDRNRVNPEIQNAGESQNGSRRENRDRSGIDPGKQNRDNSQDGSRRENLDRNRGDSGLQNRDSSQDSSRRENQDRNRVDPGLETRDRSQGGSRRDNRDRSRVEPRIKNRADNHHGSKRERRDKIPFDSRIQSPKKSHNESGRENRDCSRDEKRVESPVDPETQNRAGRRDGSRSEKRDRSLSDQRVLNREGSQDGSTIQNRNIVRPEERDRSQDREDKDSELTGGSPGEYRRRGCGSTRDGYPSHGRGGSHPGQILRIRSNSKESTCTKNASRPVNEHSNGERPRDATKPSEGFCSPDDGRKSVLRERPAEEDSDSMSRTSSFYGSVPSPNGSSGSGSRGVVDQESFSSSGAMESRGRGYFRKQSNPPTPLTPDSPRPGPSGSSGYREERQVQKCSTPVVCPPEFIGGGFPVAGRVGGVPETRIQVDRPSPQGSSDNNGEKDGQSYFERRGALRGRSASRGQPVLSRQHSTGSRSEVDTSVPNQRKGGRRGQRPQSQAQLADFVHTHPHNSEKCDKDKWSKKATPLKSDPLEPVRLVSNYYKMLSRHQWNLYRYQVDFLPEMDRTMDKRNLFRVHAKRLPGWHVFDGSGLYIAHMLPDDLEDFYSAREGREEKILVKINRNPTIISATDEVNIQIYNIIIRSCMRELGLVQVGRHYYNSKEKKDFNHQKLEIWPGYKTSMRQHEHELLLCVEMTNKVIQKETVLNVLLTYGNDRETAENELLGCIVMTKYNSRTYPIDEIKYDETPATTFPLRTGENKSFADYIQEKYPGIKVNTMNQPILYSKPKKKDIRRGMTTHIALIPELCYMTGLRDEQRRDFTLMRDINSCLQLSPTDRVKQIEKFSTLLDTKEVRSKVLRSAGLQLGNELVKVAGHIFKPEEITMGNSKKLTLQRDRYDWGSAIVQNPMFKTVELKKWAVITSAARHDPIETFLNVIKRSAHTMGFHIGEYKSYRVHGGAQGFVRQIESIVHESKGQIQMIMCVLTNPDESVYGAIKRKCYLDFGIPSQCILSKNINYNAAQKNKEKSIADRLVIQMNSKLGGVPWNVNWPFKTKHVMSAGFNISALGRQRGSTGRPSVGALVASINIEQTKYFSCIVDQEEGQTLSPLLGAKLVQAVDAYFRVNQSLPELILFYRDGMSDGQLQSVKDTEVGEIQNRLKDYYTGKGVREPSLVLIVVNKRLNTKFFVKKDNSYEAGYQNPQPGTAVDDVVTLRERYDFYLVPTKATGQGTLCPTAFNVIHDTSGFEPARIQLLTFKLCHLYYNWTSTVSVPAPCQYAHKLAFLQNLMKKTGRQSGSVEPSPQLSNTLFYL